jgi:hypothetical protein
MVIYYYYLFSCVVSPDSLYPEDDCIELWPKEGWNDAQCFWSKNVICQVNEGTCMIPYFVLMCSL